MFGSEAISEVKRNSNVDILVELDYEEKIGLCFIQMQIDLLEFLARKVDLVSANGLSKCIQPIIDEEKS